MINKKESIKKFQYKLNPEATRGFDHNADDELTAQMMDKVSNETGHVLAWGDLWVNIDPDGQTRVGYITRNGEIAIHKLAGHQEYDGVPSVLDHHQLND